jgi:hypothetical protein
VDGFPDEDIPEVPSKLRPDLLNGLRGKRLGEVLSGVVPADQS